MWTDSLPVQLRARINALIRAQPSSEAILYDLYDYLSLPADPKKRKVSPSQPLPDNLPANGPAEPANAPVVPAVPAEPIVTSVEVVDHYKLKFSGPINRNEVICELSSLSFTSPTRRKYNLVFHLFIGPDGVPQPVLSVVNLATNVPEFSIRNLLESVKLCVLFPILGNTTVPTKKDTGMLCFWLNDAAALDKSKNEPIICVINLDVVRKQLAKDGKIHPNAEAQVAHLTATSDGIKPVNGLVLEFLERQFTLCGIHLVNLMPSALPSKNALTMNSDNGVAISRLANGVNDLVSVSAYKGSKEGALVLLATPTTSYLVFGFKKPVTIVDFASIRDVSYKDITKFTYTAMVTMQVGDTEQVVDYSMIDHNSFLAVDDFIRARNIVDASFDVKLKEKSSNEKGEKGDVSPEEQDSALAAIVGSDDDEEDDDSYTGGGGGSDSGSESDDNEEFDSNLESEGEDEGREGAGGAANGVDL